MFQNRVPVRSMRVVRGDQMVQGSWVGDPLPISFVLPSAFCSVLLLLLSHKFPGLGVAHRLRASGIRCIPNKKYK